LDHRHDFSRDLANSVSTAFYFSDLGTVSFPAS
jgi:hypothetical protein